MKLSDVCIRRPVFATMMNLALILFGAISLFQLPVRELPNIDPPIVSVTTVLPGASAEVVETEVTEVLEEAISNIAGIDTITSETREQVSQITVLFELSEEVDVAAQDVRDRVARVRGQLPDDIEEPIVAKQEADAQPIMWVALFSDRFSTMELTTLAENVMKDRLQTVDGVSSILIGGGKRFAIRLRLDSTRMAARGVTVGDVEEALRAQNVELPSGRIENLARELAVQTRGELKTPEEFNRLIIRYENGAPIRLQDVGTAEAGVEDERTVARYKSLPAVGMGVVRQSRANTIAVADGIKKRVEELQPLIPEGVQTFFAYDESVFVKKSVTEVGQTVLIAFVLVVLVVFLFLRNVRTTLVPAVAIPISIVGVFAVMAVLGYSVNILTLLALVLAIGVVVDDAIVVLENIYRHIEEGMSPMAAAFQGMREVGFAIIATTLALVAVFVPLAFQTSATGQLFREFALALSGAVIISSFVALTLSPVLCSRFLGTPRKSHGAVYQSLENFFENLSSRYRRALTAAMNHRALVVLIGLIATAAGAAAFFALEKEFLPDEDKGRIFSLVIAPEGATAEYTDAYVKKLERIVAEQPEVEGYFSAVALARGAPGQSNQGLMFIRLKERSERDRSVQEIVGGPRGLAARFFAEAEGVLAFPIIPKAIGRGGSQPFQLVIQHDNLRELSRFAQQFTNELRQSGEVANVRSNFELTKPEIRVEIDRDRTASLGVSVREIARTMQVLIGGLDLSEFKRDGKLYDVIAQLEREERLTPSALERLYVRSNSGQLVQLSSVVNVHEGIGPNVINHYNRLRSATIEGTPADLPLGTVMERVEDKLAAQLPPGFSYAWAGEAEDLREAGQQTLIMFILAVIIVYMVLASQFESVIHPFTILLAVPLAGIGAFGSLWIMSLINEAGLISVSGMTLNLFSQVGLVLLIGLVTKNSILLITFANQVRETGANAIDAMIEAGEKRLRPILMTALSTVIGIMPIAIGFGAGAESRRPLGIVVVGGLITSTLLTLFVVPVIYTLLDKLSTRRRQPELERVEEPEPMPVG